jgi:hypothetical protein
MTVWSGTTASSKTSNLVLSLEASPSLTLYSPVLYVNNNSSNYCEHNSSSSRNSSLSSSNKQQQQILQQRQREVELAQQQAEAEKQQQQQRQQQEPASASSSREALVQDASAPQAQGPRRIDPAEITETRKVTATPTIAREIDERPAGRPSFPSVIVEEERKRSREDESSDESIRKKPKGKDKMPPPVSSATYNKPQPTKLRKERSSGDSTDEEGNPKKKKNSMFGGLFGRKKEKVKDKQITSVGSIESTESFTREDSDRARNEGGDGTISPTTVTAQQQQQAISVSRDSIQMEQVSPSTPDRSGTNPVSATHITPSKGPTTASFIPAISQPFTLIAPRSSTFLRSTVRIGCHAQFTSQLGSWPAPTSPSSRFLDHQSFCCRR